MKKNSTKTVNKVVETETTNIVTAGTTVTLEVQSTPKTENRGRKVDPNSPRQLRLKQQAENRAAGIDGRGRHVDTSSARQAKIQAIEAKRAAGIEIKRGRPKGSTNK